METNSIQYKRIIGEEFENRKRKNASYSLRAFARDLEISPASLSLILNGKQGLSLMKAKDIAQRLGLNAAEETLFCTSVASAHAKSYIKRKEAKSNLESNDLKFTELSLEYFKIISDWEHFAILELTVLPEFKNDKKWIANRLGINADEVESVIKRLILLELLDLVDGKLIRAKGFFSTPSGIPNRSLKKYHHQVLSKAQIALDTQSVEERDFSSVVFTMDQADLDWAKTEMAKFRKALVEKLSAKKTKNRLYQVSMQIFALDQVKTQLKPKER